METNTVLEQSSPQKECPAECQAQSQAECLQTTNPKYTKEFRGKFLAEAQLILDSGESYFLAQKYPVMKSEHTVLLVSMEKLFTRSCGTRVVCGYLANTKDECGYSEFFVLPNKPSYLNFAEAICSATPEIRKQLLPCKVKFSDKLCEFVY